MSNLVINLFSFLLLILVLVGIKPVRPFMTINNEYLSMDAVKYYKGIFSIIVVFHHLSFEVESFGSYLNAGYLAVSAFFFFSGYGLQRSYMTKGERYRKSFWKKRIPSILIPYIFVTALYWIFYWISGKYYSFNEIIVSIKKGEPIISNSWYVITIILFYLVYWILMKTCKNNYFLMIIGACAWYVVYIISCMRLEYGSWWYNATHVLIIGMIWAIFENEIIKTIKRYQIIILLIWIVFITALLSENVILSLIPISRKGLLYDFAITILFTISIILFSMKVKIGNKILAFLGNISYEVYMIHGLYIMIFSEMIYIDNNFLYSLWVLMISIITAYILHICFQKLLDAYIQIVETHGTRLL